MNPRQSTTNLQRDGALYSSKLTLDGLIRGLVGDTGGVHLEKANVSGEEVGLLEVAANHFVSCQHGWSPSDRIGWLGVN